MDTSQPLRSTSSTVRLYDTTLRDGTQREGLSFSCKDKIRIAKRLDEFGFTFVEGGWPGSNPKDQEFFERTKYLELSNAKLTAFGSTRRANKSPAEDPQITSLLGAETSVCTVFGKSSLLHVCEVLRTTREENLDMIEDTVRFLRSQGRRVLYDAEHFFDGYKEDAAYAVETLWAAIRGGAEVLVLCDTNGGSLPWEIEPVVRSLVDQLDDHPLGIHAHDDTGCGVANSLAAIRGGARHVQGTINGYGERCGNANLCAIVPNLELKLNLECVGSEKLKELFDIAHMVSELANMLPNEHMAYVGHSAFAHKGGVHVAAIRRAPSSYQHVDPEKVGNRCRVVVSELSGRGNVLSKAEELGLLVDERVGLEILEEVKANESKGMAYEAAEASFALLTARKSNGYQVPFELLDYQVTVGKRTAESASSDASVPYVEATVRVAVGDAVLHTASSGNGPVSALDKALRKALTTTYPAIEAIQLTDYKVRILDGKDGTNATTRVLIDHRKHGRSFSTVGACANIIAASLAALVDGIEYGLMLDSEAQERKGPQWIGRKDHPAETTATRMRRTIS